MESTGRYHLLCAFLLSQSGYNVRVINPLLARKYLTARIHNHKTDKADAAILAEIAVKEEEQNLPEAFPCSLQDISIRQKMGLLSSLEKAIQKLQSIIGEYQQFQHSLGIESSVAERTLQEQIHEFRKTRASLE